EIGVNGRVVARTQGQRLPMSCPRTRAGTPALTFPFFSAPLYVQTNPFLVRAIQPIISRSFHPVSRERRPGPTLRLPCRDDDALRPERLRYALRALGRGLREVVDAF